MKEKNRIQEDCWEQVACRERGMHFRERSKKDGLDARGRRCVPEGFMVYENLRSIAASESRESTWKYFLQAMVCRD